MPERILMCYVILHGKEINTVQARQKLKEIVIPKRKKESKNYVQSTRISNEQSPWNCYLVDC